MQFHLILPGLLWPSQALRDTAHDLLLPGLSWLLGRGRLSWQAALPLENWLCREFGCGLQQPPAAALRLLGEGGAPGKDIWLCADPVHLHFEQGRPCLSSAELGISPDEMQQLATALAPLFAELGDFRTGVPGHGYLRLRALPQLQALPPSAALGRSHPLPSGAGATLWRRLGNEAQMLLHTLPLNVRREAKGKPTLNSLWFWGAGVLPARSAAIAAPDRHIVGRQPLLPGLAAWSGLAHSSTAEDCATLLHKRQATLLLLDDLLAPTQQLDATAWRAALLAIEQNWLQPLRSALRAGQLSSVRLTALGDETALDLHLSRAAAFKFWRRATPLHELTIPQSSAPP
ncbi:MAG: hypothetical protein NTY41_17800 [Proteobacteria bacterium]|nr:hypothetical protein [Pseudomonadota bacterium]